MMRHSAWTILRAGFCVATIGFLVAPMLLVLIISFSSAEFLTFPPPGWSLQWYRHVFTDPEWSDTLANTVRIVLPVGVLATAIGTAASIGLVRAEFPGRTLVMGLLMAPLVVPVIVVGAGVFELFTRAGLNGTWAGFVLAHTMITVPYVISIVTAALSTVSEQYEQAARTLGAPPWTVFKRILFPMIAPSVFSGMLFAMVVSFDELIVSLFISTPTFKPITVQMWSDVMGDVNPTIAAIGSLLFVFSLLVLVVEGLLRRRGGRGLHVQG
jgi:putative spermidine/putrescine transport system permease protein